MAMVRRDRVNGTVFDLATIQGLPTEPCNVLVVSDRTLHVLNLLSRNEVTWFARYSRYQVGDFFLAVNADDSDGVDTIIQTANNLGLELQMATTLDNLVDAVDRVAAAIASSGCGCAGIGDAGDNEAGQQSGTIPSDVGEITYDYGSVIARRQCRAANWMVDNWANVFTELNDANIDQLGGIALGTMMTLVSGIAGAALAGPFGAIIGAVAGLYLAVAQGILSGSVEFQDIINLLISERDDLVCALQQARTVETARTDFLAVLSVAGLSSANLSMMEVFMPNAVMNTLFFAATGTESELDGYTQTTSCQVCKPVCESNDNWVMHFGTGDPQVKGTVLSSVQVSGPSDHRIQINDFDETSTTNTNRRAVTLTNLTDFISNPLPNSVRFIDIDGASCDVITSYLAEDGPFPTNIPCVGFWLESTQPFTVTYTFEEI